METAILKLLKQFLANIKIYNLVPQIQGLFK